MSFTITPNSVEAGANVTAKLKYTRPTPPKPTDVHIDAKQTDGSWRAITGYDRIPAPLDPVTGFDLPFSTGNPNVGAPGKHTFRLRWTLEGVDMAAAMEQFDVTLIEAISFRAKVVRLCPPGWDCKKVIKAIGDALRKNR